MGDKEHICDNCGWYDYWFSTCLNGIRKPVHEDHTCEKWESFEEPKSELEEE